MDIFLFLDVQRKSFMQNDFGIATWLIALPINKITVQKELKRTDNKPQYTYVPVTPVFS